jgi:hypothetical protein
VSLDFTCRYAEIDPCEATGGAAKQEVVVACGGEGEPQPASGTRGSGALAGTLTRVFVPPTPSAAGCTSQ